MSGSPETEDRMILAGCFDLLSQIRWMLAGSQGAAPKSMVHMLLGIDDGNSSEVVSYDTPEEWEAARRRILEGMKCQQQN